MTNTASSVDARGVHGVSERGLLGVAALLFVASAVASVVWCNAMPPMSPVPMAWMPMCGQTWPTFAASFIGMWTVMMVAMMLPSLLPTLRRYRAALHAGGEPRADLSTAVAAAWYFVVWTAIGAVVFALGATMTQLTLMWPVWARALPVAGAAIVLAAGALQFSAWKARQLARCRAAPLSGGSAWRDGLRLGQRCATSCAGLTAILLMAGVMDLQAMLAVSAAVTLERLAPAGWHVARAVGAVAVVAGLHWLVRAVVGL